MGVQSNIRSRDFPEKVLFKKLKVYMFSPGI